MKFRKIFDYLADLEKAPEGTTKWAAAQMLRGNKVIYGENKYPHYYDTEWGFVFYACPDERQAQGSIMLWVGSREAEDGWRIYEEKEEQ